MLPGCTARTIAGYKEEKIYFYMLKTQRLFLIPSTLPMLEAIAAEDWAALSFLLGGVDFAERWLHFPDAIFWMRDYMREHPDAIGWWNYLIVHQQDVRVIGSCGYKGPPIINGEVEIGYEIADGYQLQGLATEAARALVTHAFSFEAVTAVIAQTLAEENASVSLLRRLGFQFEGEHIDIEDGKLWAWRKGEAGNTTR